MLNGIAFNALHDARVLEHFGRQRRPIQVTFDWPSIEQHGFILFKAAPFVLDQIQEKDCDVAISPLWVESFQDAYQTSNCADGKWAIVNNFLQRSLLCRGAEWGNGPKQRAQPPLFVAKAIAPKQLVNHSACTARGHKLALSLSTGSMNSRFAFLDRKERLRTNSLHAKQLAKRGDLRVLRMPQLAGTHLPHHLLLRFSWSGNGPTKNSLLTIPRFGCDE